MLPIQFGFILSGFQISTRLSLAIAGHILILTKCSSGNCHVEQNVSAGKLQEGKPVGRFLAPASADASAFGEPAECALNDPATCGVLRFAGDRTEIDFGFAAKATVLDMGDIVFELEEVPDIGVVIAACH